VAENPLFEHVLTAAPAALVDGDTVWLYTGHDEAPNNDVFFEMHDWLVFSSKDMKTWEEHGPIMKAVDFGWATGEAWASHMVKRDRKSYFIYHTGAVPPRDGEPSGGRVRRSVAIDRLYYNEDGTLKRVIMTSEGIQ
jgi:hypothetical protein